MAPAAVSGQIQPPNKLKRPTGSGIQTGANGTPSSSSPSPSLSSKKPPVGAKASSGSAATYGTGGTTTGSRPVNRQRKDTPSQLLGRGQRNGSTSVKSTTLTEEGLIEKSSGPVPYVKSDGFILRKYRGQPPSLIVHFHQAHFRFDNQPTTFTYKSPMRIFLEHLKERTVPHDMLEHLEQAGVRFYSDCLIVQIHDHRSVANAEESTRTASGGAKVKPFSVHNWNQLKVPSSYKPFPEEAQASQMRDKDRNDKVKPEQNKENMPAPAQRSKSEQGREQSKVFTVVLHPTSLSRQASLALRAFSAVSTSDGNESSFMFPPNTPISAVPPTPITIASAARNMDPPAKKVKKDDLNSSNYFDFEANVVKQTSGPLFLDSIDTPEECRHLLEALAHPLHSEKPPSPKTRKRTVAEVAADEAAAADTERYMLILDERLSATGAGSLGAKPGDADGQTGAASFEPRFEKFKIINEIKLQIAENERLKKLQEIEATNRRREQEAQRAELLKREQEEKARQMRELQIQQRQQLQQTQERVRMAQQASQNHQAMQNPNAQMQGGHHSHPSNPQVMGNMQSASQRFQQQQGPQGAQAASPVLRQGTPHNMSSPMVTGNMSNPMQPTTSSMGGSPPRPGSVVHQNNPSAAAMAHSMSTQRSQQSHNAGTPRMPSATPNLSQSTPVMRATPRMTQGSPLPAHMVQTPHMNQPIMQNGQMMQPNAQQIQAIAMQQRMAQQAVVQGFAGTPGQMGQMSPEHMAAIRAAHAQMRNTQNPNMMGQNPMSAQYQAQMQAMMSMNNQNMQNGGQQNFMNGHGQTMNAAQMQARQQQLSQMNPMQRQLHAWQQQTMQRGMNDLRNQYGSDPPQAAIAQLQTSVKVKASQMIQRQQMAMQHRAAAQQHGMGMNMGNMGGNMGNMGGNMGNMGNMNGMGGMNGMGMQRPPGM